jgi:hypothetical protein
MSTPAEYHPFTDSAIKLVLVFLIATSTSVVSALTCMPEYASYYAALPVFMLSGIVAALVLNRAVELLVIACVR